MASHPIHPPGSAPGIEQKRMAEQTADRTEADTENRKDTAEQTCRHAGQAWPVHRADMQDIAHMVDTADTHADTAYRLTGLTEHSRLTGLTGHSRLTGLTGHSRLTGLSGHSRLTGHS